MSSPRCSTCRTATCPRRVSASSRHLVLGLAIACSLTLPLLELVAPTWEVAARCSVRSFPGTTWCTRVHDGTH
ncbi:MAG: hypothetical protein ABIF77_03245 [bacterium]